MDELQRRVIIDYWDRLVEELPSQDLIDRLIADRIIDQEEAINIDILPDNKDRNIEIMQHLLASRSSHSYQLFIQALESLSSISSKSLLKNIQNRLDQLQHQKQLELSKRSMENLILGKVLILFFLFPSSSSWIHM